MRQLHDCVSIHMLQYAGPTTRNRDMYKICIYILYIYRDIDIDTAHIHTVEYSTFNLQYSTFQYSTLQSITIHTKSAN